MASRSIALISLLMLLALLGPSPIPAAIGASAAELPKGFRIEGTWSVRPPGGFTDGEPRHFVRFGSGNSLIWYESSEAGCTASRHRYWNRSDRLVVQPALPGARSWWQLEAESNSRIMLLERFAEQPPRSQRVRLVRAGLPEGCGAAEPFSAPR